MVARQPAVFSSPQQWRRFCRAPAGAAQLSLSVSAAAPARRGSAVRRADVLPGESSATAACRRRPRSPASLKAVLCVRRRAPQRQAA